MAIRQIVKEGDDVLTKKCRTVEKFDGRLSQLIDDMTETLHLAKGAGLAAPQVGVLRRVVVIEVEPGEVIELINPEIIYSSGSQTGLEGCLSLPGQYGIVTRPNFVTVRAQDRYGDWYEYDGEELVARCFCHEIDHLDGHMYTEIAERMLSPEELEEIMKQDKEAEEAE